MKRKLMRLYISISLVLISLINSKVTSFERDGSGNWYEKLHWWKKARPIYQEIVLAIARIKKYKSEFITKRSVISTNVQELWDFLAIDKDIAKEKITNLLAETEADLEDLFNRDSEDQDEINELNVIKKNLEKLQQDLQLIEEGDTKIEDTLYTVAEQIKRAENYENTALDLTDDLEKVLDEKKAKNLYERIENQFENIKAIESYVSGTLINYTNQLSIRLNQLINEVKTLVSELEKSNIFISEARKEEIKKNEPQPKKPEAPKSEQLSLLQKIFSLITNFLSKIWYILTFPFRWLF